MTPMYYHTDTGVKTILLGKPSRKLTPVLMITDHGLIVRKVPNSDTRFMSPAPTTTRTNGGVLKQYASIGHRLGATKQARKFLKRARA